eukprot:scaffold211076_cov23-Cyclotella_meneghiniana.AAC.1
MEQMMLIAPLSLLGCPSRGRLPMKKYPDALLFEYFALSVFSVAVDCSLANLLRVWGIVVSVALA